jgi:hypothetical protein
VTPDQTVHAQDGVIDPIYNIIYMVEKELRERNKDYFKGM